MSRCSTLKWLRKSGVSSAGQRSTLSLAKIIFWRTCSLWPSTGPTSSFMLFPDRPDPTGNQANQGTEAQCFVSGPALEEQALAHRVKSSQVKSSHLYLCSAFNNTNCVKATAQYQNRKTPIFQLKAFHCWIQCCHRPAQFSLKSICAIKAVILLEMKCPQLSNPEATTARNQNSIGDRTEKKTLRETRLSRGGSSPLARRISSLLQLQQSQILRPPLVPVVFSR